MSAARTLNTPFGRVTVEPRVGGGAAPALLCIRGIWAPKGQLTELLHVFPRHDMIIGDIPGMWSQPPDPSTIETFARIYDDVIRQLLPQRPVVVLGVSTGALVSLAMKSPQVRGMVVVEPFLSTADVWPLIQNMQHRLISNAAVPHIAVTRKYIYEIFGYTEDSVENIDFAPLLDALSVPTSAIVGAVPLGEPRQLAQWPSLAGPRTRDLLSSHERVEFYEGPPESGHNVTGSPAGLGLTAQLLRGHLDRI